MCMKTKLENIKIAPKVHKQVVVHCRKNGMKIYYFVEQALLAALEEQVTAPYTVELGCKTREEADQLLREYAKRNGIDPNAVNSETKT